MSEHQWQPSELQCSIGLWRNLCWVKRVRGWPVLGHFSAASLVTTSKAAKVVERLQRLGSAAGREPNTKFKMGKEWWKTSGNLDDGWIYSCGSFLYQPPRIPVLFLWLLFCCFYFGLINLTQAQVNWKEESTKENSMHPWDWPVGAKSEGHFLNQCLMWEGPAHLGGTTPGQAGEAMKRKSVRSDLSQLLIHFLPWLF